MTSELPALVLRGSGDAVLRRQDDAVTLRRARDAAATAFATTGGIGWLTAAAIRH
ncbi:hypothetical protein AB0G79_07700 [Streptomyces sp. NPDC020807]|uniref:hypothetical protein n=1 Tax=Streptomyces sp. NPDC020807 TaxID=3155119 RepID=UPI00340F7DC0